VLPELLVQLDLLDQRVSPGKQVELDRPDKLDCLVILANRETAVQLAQQVARDQLVNQEVQDLLDYRVQWDSQDQLAS
jgi:hypothetical protein